jgi:hypothetical protein
MAWLRSLAAAGEDSCGTARPNAHIEPAMPATRADAAERMPPRLALRSKHRKLL